MINLSRDIEKLETFIGIKKGLEDIATGNTQSLNQFIEEMQKKHGIK
ncbi:hypothetical protein VB711_16115 [Cronbergia sp. UHCC 0137]|nr:hypothetical protein [Cronbergia sp. UHCC 0137]MEA5619355.1 hypothetical protein [Cronbergia sp. UHCC 0137]